jgi:hypothetical protein
MQRLTITLSDDEQDALCYLAKKERRDAGQQAAYILSYELERQGLLSDSRHLQKTVEEIQNIPQLSISINNYIEVIVGENNMGDNIVITGNKDSIFNMNTNLTKVNQSINRFSETNSLIYEINHLISELENELGQVPDENKEEAEAVLECARSLIEEATKAKPDKTRIMISGDRLLTAAKNIATIMPAVLSIATQIVETITKLSG